MSRQEIAARIKSFLEQEFPGQGVALTEETSLLEDYFLDSFGIIDTVMFLEKTFGIAVSRADINGTNFHNIRSLAEFVSRSVGS